MSNVRIRGQIKFKKAKKKQRDADIHTCSGRQLSPSSGWRCYIHNDVEGYVEGCIAKAMNVAA